MASVDVKYFPDRQMILWLQDNSFSVSQDDTVSLCFIGDAPLGRQVLIPETLNQLGKKLLVLCLPLSISKKIFLFRYGDKFTRWWCLNAAKDPAVGSIDLLGSFDHRECGWKVLLYLADYSKISATVTASLFVTSQDKEKCGDHD